MQSRLSSIGEIILGHTFRWAIDIVPDGNYQVLQAKNLKKGGALDMTDLATIFLEKTRTQAFVQTGDVLLSNRGIFRSAVYEGDHRNLIAASSLYIIRIRNTQKVLPHYLAVYLNSSIGQSALESMNLGTLIKSLTKRSLIELSVPLPPIATQQTIIDIHRNYETRAALYERKSSLEQIIATQTIASLLSH